MEVTDEVTHKIHALMERFWKDVSGLPWQDSSWVKNVALREQSRTHFVNATANDIIDIMKGVDNATVPSND